VHAASGAISETLGRKELKAYTPCKRQIRRQFIVGRKSRNLSHGSIGAPLKRFAII
jgi:hypothetical protein